MGGGEYAASAAPVALAAAAAAAARGREPLEAAPARGGGGAADAPASRRARFMRSLAMKQKTGGGMKMIASDGKANDAQVDESLRVKSARWWQRFFEVPIEKVAKIPLRRP